MAMVEVYVHSSLILMSWNADHPKTTLQAYQSLPDSE
jgi:hypothetical protein